MSFIRLSALCGQNENGIICARAWLSALGPIIAVAALSVALLQFYLADITAERTLRAYVLLETSHVGPIAPNQPIDVTIGVKNFGKTPSLKTTHMAMMGLSNFPGSPPPFNPPSNQPMSKTILAPEQSNDKFFHYPAISQADYDALLAGNKALYVVGEIVYEDVYGKKRHSLYRRMIGGNIGMSPTGSMAGTESDDEAN